MNHIHLIGYLGNDPEIKEKNGTTCARLSLAVTNAYKDKEGNRQEHTDWIPVVAFRGLAKTLEHVKKGARIAVYGRLKTQSYETKEGERRTSFEVVAKDITFLTRGGRGTSEEPDGGEGFPDVPAGGEADDEVPF